MSEEMALPIKFSEAAAKKVKTLIVELVIFCLTCYFLFCLFSIFMLLIIHFLMLMTHDKL